MAPANMKILTEASKKMENADIFPNHDVIPLKVCTAKLDREENSYRRQLYAVLNWIDPRDAMEDLQEIQRLIDRREMDEN
ncbi:hypothetical protein QE152_g15405 [Popillia japonica]|uniref:Uncharacterized protein n=1 Tax=Popillia japonica TaxID=7064 RepID=A0AAW1L5Q1_POPJA